MTEREAASSVTEKVVLQTIHYSFSLLFTKPLQKARSKINVQDLGSHNLVPSSQISPLCLSHISLSKSTVIQPGLQNLLRDWIQMGPDYLLQSFFSTMAFCLNPNHYGSRRHCGSHVKRRRYVRLNLREFLKCFPVSIITLNHLSNYTTIILSCKTTFMWSF